MAKNQSNNDIYKQYNLSENNSEHKKLVSLHNYYQNQIEKLSLELQDERKQLQKEEAFKWIGTNTDDNKEKIKELEEKRSMFSYELRNTKYDMMIAGLENEKKRLSQTLGTNAIKDHQLSIEGRQKAINERVNTLKEMGLSGKELVDGDFSRLNKEQRTEATHLRSEIERLNAEIDKFNQLIDKVKERDQYTIHKMNELDEKINNYQLAKECNIADHNFTVSLNSMAQMQKTMEKLDQELKFAKHDLDSLERSPLKETVFYHNRQERYEARYEQAKERYDTFMLAAKDTYKTFEQNAKAFEDVAAKLNRNDPNVVQTPDFDHLLEKYDFGNWHEDTRQKEQEQKIDLDSLGSSIVEAARSALEGATKIVDNVIDLDSLDQQHNEKQWDKGFWRDVNDRNAAGLKEFDTDIKDPGFEKDLDDHNFRDR